MEYLDAEEPRRLELTRRNLEALLAKLDDPLSARTLSKIGVAGSLIEVVAVENEVHYAHRAPGAVFMPSTGEEWDTGPYPLTDDNPTGDTG